MKDERKGVSPIEELVGRLRVAADHEYADGTWSYGELIHDAASALEAAAAREEMLMEIVDPGCTDMSSQWSDGDSVAYFQTQTARQDAARQKVGKIAQALASRSGEEVEIRHGMETIAELQEQLQASETLLRLRTNDLVDVAAERDSLRAESDRLREALRLHKAWADSESTGPDYGGQTRDTHPDGERIWRAWWNNQLDLCDRANRATHAALNPAGESAAASSSDSPSVQERYEEFQNAFAAYKAASDKEPRP